MFNIGDSVVYQSLGVCRVKDIRKECFPPLEEQFYYVLELIYGPCTTVYAPVGNDKLNIRRILSAAEVKELIRSMPDVPALWVEDDRLRREEFQRIIKGGDRTELVLLIKTLFCKRSEQLAAGKKFHAADEKLMKDAERILYEELALVLDIEPDEVEPFIAGEIEAREKTGQPSAHSEPRDD